MTADGTVVGGNCFLTPGCTCANGTPNTGANCTIDASLCNGAPQLYAEGKHCSNTFRGYKTGLHRMSGGVSVSTNTLAKCQALAVQKCKRKDYFYWNPKGQPQSGMCWCEDDQYCDSPTSVKSH